MTAAEILTSPRTFSQETIFSQCSLFGMVVVMVVLVLVAVATLAVVVFRVGDDVVADVVVVLAL
jgi:uncharacterized membrane protein